MILTTEALADMIIKYINRRIDLSGLVDWAENMMRESDFEAEHFEIIRDVLAHVGLADVRDSVFPGMIVMNIFTVSAIT